MRRGIGVTQPRAEDKEVCMNIFAMFGGNGMDAGVKEFENTPGALLLDVRTREEYAGRHVANSVNVPLDELNAVAERTDRNVPLFVYCLSGARSGQAVRLLKRYGFKDVRNIGGIASYRGKVVK